MNVEVDRPVEEYLAGVRAALSDLPPGEVGEIVDDVRGHLADLRAEVGRDADPAVFTARLGTPQAYAAELRAAAGYPAAPQAGSSARGRRRRPVVVGVLVAAFLLLLLAGFGIAEGLALLLVPAVLLGAALLLVPAVPELARRVPGVAAMPVVQRLTAALREPRGVLAFVVSLQPAWWVLRALVAAALFAAVLDGGILGWLIVAALFVPLSVGLGHLSRRDRRWLWAVVPLNVLAAVLVPAALAASAPPTSSSSEQYSLPYPGLWQDGEREITDIRPVDSSGTPLTGVYLFDQDGRPIDTGDPCSGYGYGSGDDPDGTGTGSTDPYPRGSAEYDDSSGRCTVVPPAPLVVAVPSPTPSSGPSATAPAAPTVTPTATPPAPPASAPPAPPAPSLTAEPTPIPAPPTG